MGEKVTKKNETTMNIKYIEGDIFAGINNDDSPGAIILPHVVNDKKAFGAGFVIPLARQFPIVKQEYLKWAESDGYDVAFSEDPCFILGNTQFVNVDDKVFVANMLAQTLGGKRPLYYNHLARCMDEVAQFVFSRTQSREHEARIFCPAFGSGLSGGYWPFVEQLIDDCWIRRNISVTVFYLKDTLPEGLVPVEIDQ